MLGLVTAAAAAESGGAQMPQFDVTTFSSQIFWLAIAVVVLFAVLRWGTLPRIQESIANRHQAISSDVQRADELNRKANELATELEQKLSSVHQQAAETARKQHQKTLVEIEAMEQAAHEHIDEAAQAGEARIREIRETALSDVATVAKDVAATLVENVLPGGDHRPATSAAVDRLLQRTA